MLYLAEYSWSCWVEWYYTFNLNRNHESFYRVLQRSPRQAGYGADGPLDEEILELIDHIADIRS